MALLRNIMTAAAFVVSAAHAHYANMALDDVSCYIYNGIKGTADGHMIIRHENGVWVDHDDVNNHGNVTVIKSQSDYDNLDTKPKIGIVCAPDNVDSAEIGIPYVEMEPTDEDFYSDEQTVYTGLPERPYCIFMFCRNAN